MTLSTTTSRVNYPGTGSAGPFAFPFRIQSAADLRVTKRSAGGGETTLAEGTDFTVTGVLSSSGTVTLTTALADGEVLSIRRAPARTQPTSIRNLGPYFAGTHEDVFDRLAMQLQDVQDQLDRTFGLSESFDPADYSLKLPGPVGGYVVGWNTAGTDLVSAPAQSFAFLTTGLEGLNLKDVQFAGGAKGDGSTNDTAAILAWAQAVAGADTVGYVPAGTYMMTAVTFTALSRIHIMGPGVFKRIDNTISAGNITPMFTVENTAGIRAFVRVDVATDGNCQNQPVPVPVTQFEQAHNWNITPVDTRGIVFQSVGASHYNALGDGFGLRSAAGGTFKAIIIDSLYAEGRLYSRSDVCVTASYDVLLVTNSDGDSFQTEINAAAAGHRFETLFSNVDCRPGSVSGFDLDLPTGTRAPCSLVGVTAKGVVNLTGFDFKIVACDIATTQPIRLLQGYYEWIGGRLGTYTGFALSGVFETLIENITTPGQGARFTGVEFHNDGGASSAVLKAIFGDNGVLPASTPRGIEFFDCRFNVTTALSAFFRSGRYSFVRCRHYYDGVTQAGGSVGGNAIPTGTSAICQGTSSTATFANIVSLFDNFIENAVAYLYEPAQTSTTGVDIYSYNPRVQPGFSINFGTRYDRIAAPHGSGTVQRFKQLDRWDESAAITLTSGFPTTGKWLKGQKLYYADPATTGFVGIVCTVSGNGDGSAATGSATGAAWKKFGPIALEGSAVFDPASLADGAGATTTVTVTGAALGDYAEASFSNALQGITLTAWVSAADTVSVRFQNESGGVLDLASGTLRARVKKA